MEQKIMTEMHKIKYGWLDINGQKNLNTNNLFQTKYLLQSPEEVIKNKIGVCWDQVELERYYFNKNNINCQTYFIIYYDGPNTRTHTFLTYKKNNQYCWFEHSWEKFQGIHIYDSLNNLLLDVKNKFIKEELVDNCNINNILLFEYEKPEYNLSAQDFCKHCEKGRNIILN